MRELPQKARPGMPVMKMYGLDAAKPASKPKAKPTKKVAENITEEYLKRREEQQFYKYGGDDDGTPGAKKLQNTTDWLDRIIRKRLLTKDFRAK